MTASFPETADIETSSADYASRFAGAAGRFFLETQTGMVLSCLDPIPDKRVLDVGGGHCQLAAPLTAQGLLRSEERRVGKECRSRWSPYH